MKWNRYRYVEPWQALQKFGRQNARTLIIHEGKQEKGKAQPRLKRGRESHQRRGGRIQDLLASPSASRKSHGLKRNKVPSQDWPGVNGPDKGPPRKVSPSPGEWRRHVWLGTRVCRHRGSHRPWIKWQTSILTFGLVKIWKQVLSILFFNTVLWRSPFQS